MNAVTVKKITISYRLLNKFSIKKNLLKKKKKSTKEEKFNAIKNVSFELEKGKILGVVGKNGSGKSTLLRAMAGIFSVDEGTIDLHGNTVSLLSIGVGFQKKLTGYENIFLSGLLLGFNKKQIEEKLDEIIEFSELGDFINKPVSTYSSGMYSKLAFAITAILETDIMLIDEVLSVGDISFKQKSYDKMKELINDDDRTVIIVSHNLSTLKELCDEILWIHEGSMKMIGDTKTVLAEYESFMKKGVAK